jgi:glutaredoxin 3
MNFLNEGKKAMVKKLAGDYDEVAVRKRLDSLIRENPVLMLSFETCPFCVKAREILDAKNAKYFDLDLTKDPDGKAIRAELANLVGRTSVPAIWIDSQFIGGCNDGPMGGIAKLNDEGKLDSMLKAVKAI